MQKIRKFLEFLSLVKKSLNGDLAYKSYLDHAKSHKEKTILSKKEFLLKRRDEKSKKINRCC